MEPHHTSTWCFSNNTNYIWKQRDVKRYWQPELQMMRISTCTKKDKILVHLEGTNSYVFFLSAKETSLHHLRVQVFPLP